MKAKNNKFKIKKVLFNDGFLTAYNIEGGIKKVVQASVPFGNETVTENRFNAALSDDVRIVKVVHIPLNNGAAPLLPDNAFIEIDGSAYEIWKQQPITSTNPPIIVLQLKDFKDGLL